MGEQFMNLAALLVLVYGLFSALAARTFTTPPMAFMLIGLLVGPGVLGYVNIEFQGEQMEALAKLALVIILCTDASEIDRRSIQKFSALPARLLLIGLPLTLIAGAAVGALLFPGFEFAAIALLAAILAPTDAALGQAVITNEAVPLEIREGLNVESGLNDGIALVPVLGFLFVLGAELGDVPTDNWPLLLATQLLLGPLAGALVGGGGGRLVDLATNRGWVDPGFQRLAMPAIAVLSYGLAEAIGGNGFIAAFVSGLALDVRNPAARRHMQKFSETEGTLLTLLVFLVLGMTVIHAAAPYWNLRTTAYAVLSLTLVRMIPVAISLSGLGNDWRTVFFLGWFGPRGIASILYLLLFVHLVDSSGFEPLIATGVQTIFMSTVLHGISAAPLARRYGRWARARASA